MADLCVTCLRDTDSKAKPGIFPCIGCKQMFCTQHVAFHRQELTNELDLVIGERNELQDLFDHERDSPDTSLHMKIIDEWVKKTIEQVYQAADKARQRLIDIAQEQRTNIKDEFTELSKQLNNMRENENFFEQDVTMMKDKCSCLKAAINQVNTNLNTADVCRYLDEAIIFKQTKQTTIEVLSYVEDILKYEKPYKRIELPHDGTLYLGDGLALIKNKRDYSIVNFGDNSMRSISLETLNEQVHCWSSYHNAYLSKNYLIKNGLCPKTIQFIPVSDTSRKYELTINNEGNIASIACFADILLTVGSDQMNNTVIEEWRLNNANQNQGTPSVELVSRWRPPLSCSTDESIKKIVFNNKHIVLAINNPNRSPKNRLEFRTRGMHVLGYIALNDNVDFISMSVVAMKDGWMLGQKRNRDQPKHYILIDNDLHKHEQKFLSNQNIENIAVVSESLNRQLIAVYRKTSNVYLPTQVNQRFILDLYELQEKQLVAIAAKNKNHSRK